MRSTSSFLFNENDRVWNNQFQIQNYNQIFNCQVNWFPCYHFTAIEASIVNMHGKPSCAASKQLNVSIVLTQCWLLMLLWMKMSEFGIRTFVFLHIRKITVTMLSTIQICKCLCKINYTVMHVTNLQIPPRKIVQ